MITLITLFEWPPDVTEGITSALLITIGGLIIFQIAFIFIRRWGKKKQRFVPTILNKYLYYPGFLLFFAIALNVSFPFVQSLLPTLLYDNIKHGLYIFVISCAAFLIIRGVTVFREIMVHQYYEENPRDFSMRKAKTKFMLIQRVLNFLIIIIAVAVALMTFEEVRKIGGTMLASAGVAGLVVAFAAQKSLGSLFAGIQIALAQPVRLDDTVVVEDEFGTISEINLTFVVLSTWDGRRKIIPINYFLENSFENWTRETPEVIGKVKIKTDYSLPVENIRKEFLSWVKSSDLWDKRACGLIVSNSDENGMEIRGTFSAKNPDDAWDLECQMREKLVTYIQKNYPDTLPQTRMLINENSRRKNKSFAQLKQGSKKENNTNPGSSKR